MCFRNPLVLEGGGVDADVDKIDAVSWAQALATGYRRRSNRNSRD
jgi:hypothetical protein